MLFNLDIAKRMRLETSEVVVVEGYMDVVSLYSKGIKNVIANSGTALTEGQIELIWKFFSNPILCLDGDESGQKAALRIAERLFPLINENHRIYFSILPSNEDPDDYIKKNGKEMFLNFLKQKKIIQLYIWDLYSEKINKNDPYAISKFEKEIKKLCYSIKDEILRKYILEDFLEKIKKLTPIQNTKKSFKQYQNFRSKEDYKILRETTNLHKQKSHFTKEQLKEYSILFIMLNNPNIVKSMTEELSEIKFSTEKCELLKIQIISEISSSSKIDKNEETKKLIIEIEKNSNLALLIKKNDAEIKEMLIDLLSDIKEMNHMKKIQFLEAKVVKNLDESSYSELIELKNQLNRE